MEDQAPSAEENKRAKKPKKSKKPTAHEDIVDGFAFLAFKNYEDLQVTEVKGGKGCM